jgi:hypothetical protein
MAYPETGRPATAPAASEPSTFDPGKEIDRKSSEPTFDRQAHRLAFAFYMPLPTARAVATLAFAKGVRR